MWRINFLIFTLILAITIPSNFGQSGISENPIVTQITIAANNDNVSNKDLGERYALYEAASLYGSKFDFENAVSFDDIVIKMGLITEKLNQEPTDELGNSINKILSSYDGKEFDDNSKNKFIEEMHYISLGLRGAID